MDKNVVNCMHFWLTVYLTERDIHFYRPLLRKWTELSLLDHNSIMVYLDFNHPPLLKKSGFVPFMNKGKSIGLILVTSFKKIILFLLKVSIRYVYHVIVCMSSRFILSCQPRVTVT